MLTIRRRILPLAGQLLTTTVIIVLTLTSAVTHAVELPGLCISFSEMKDTKYVVGNSDVISAIKVGLREFNLGNGTTDEGTATVSSIDLYGLQRDDNTAIFLNNINLHVLLPKATQHLTLRYGYYGGNVNLQINGESHFWRTIYFPQIDGISIGGVHISAFDPNARSDFYHIGVLEFNTAYVDQIDTLMIGGQELFIDDICLRYENWIPVLEVGSVVEHKAFQNLHEITITGYQLIQMGDGLHLSYTYEASGLTAAILAKYVRPVGVHWNVVYWDPINMNIQDEPE